MKKFKSLLVFIFSIISLMMVSANLQADNIMQIHDVSGEPSDTVTVNIEIVNDSAFVAFQLDLPLSAQVSYVLNSISLTDRSSGHTIIANIINNDTLRIFAYSPTNSAFSGNSGNVANFQLVSEMYPEITL